MNRSVVWSHKTTSKLASIIMSPAHRRKHGVPDRWLDYRAVGKRLPGTRFVAFKVPLKLSLNSRLESCNVFGHWELLDILKRENEELGLIIDLTFTTRYYRPEDVPESLSCVKIFTAGHEVPSDKTILSFKRTVRRFLRENIQNDKLIGVHCTHGLNRTGYLICRYLIDVDGLDPQEAITLFNSSRGHTIERKNYLDDLQSGRKRSNEGMEESEQEPVQGSATHRPVYSEASAANVEDRAVRSPESPHNWRQKPRHSQSWREDRRPVGPSSSGSYLLPSPVGQTVRSVSGGPGLLPLPAFPPACPRFRPYRWAGGSTPPQPHYQWPGPPLHSSGARGGGDFLHGLSSSPCPPQWTNDTVRHSRDDPEEWDGPRMRHQPRHNHRVNYSDY